MSNITYPKVFLAATAALVAVPAASALLANHDAHTSHMQEFGRPSLIPMDANHQPFSELDKLRAKRLSIRRRPEPEVDAAVDTHDAELVTRQSLAAGLEYLYEADEERHSDDLFHLILMPSTFTKDHMSIENIAESCTAVLGIPSDKAHDLSLFAKHQGFSCLGSWTRNECLSKGEDLLSKGLDCRVIPFNGAGLPPTSLLEGSTVVTDMNSPKVSFDNSYLLSLSI